MSDRLSEISRRITAARKVGAVMDGIRGIALTRAREARALLPAIGSHVEIAEQAIAKALQLARGLAAPPSLEAAAERPLLVLFGAEQGFCGDFPERALDAALDGFAAADWIAIGSRTAWLAVQRGIALVRSLPIPSRAAELPDLAIAVEEAICTRLSDAGTLQVHMIHASLDGGDGTKLVVRRLLPFDRSCFAPSAAAIPPLANLRPAELLVQLSQDYVFAKLCEAAVQTFICENEARVTKMLAGRDAIDERLDTLRAQERHYRQERITEEVAELAAASLIGARLRR